MIGTEDLVSLIWRQQEQSLVSPMLCKSLEKVKMEYQDKDNNL